MGLLARISRLENKTSAFKAFVPTGTWTSNVTYAGIYKKNNGYLYVQGKIACSGLVTATTLSVNLPSGFFIDLSNIEITGRGGAEEASIGVVTCVDAGVRTYDGVVVYGTTSSVNLTNLDTGAAGNHITNVAPFTFNAGDFVTFNFKVPIIG